jgi:hypothetical protein
MGFNSAFKGLKEQASGTCSTFKKFSALMGPKLDRYFCWKVHKVLAWVTQSGNLIPVRERNYAPAHTGPGAHPASYIMGTGSFPEVNRPGRGVDHPPTSRARVKERAKLYLYFFMVGKLSSNQTTSVKMKKTHLTYPKVFARWTFLYASSFALFGCDIKQMPPGHKVKFIEILPETCNFNC